MIDFHTHLDLFPDPHAVVRQCVADRMYVLSVTTTPSAWSGTSKLAKRAPRVRTALGLHPQLVHERAAEIHLFADLLPRVSFVGEVGLDGSEHHRNHWKQQEAVFKRILELCTSAGGRTLTIHSRNATSAVLDHLAAHLDAGTPILHWFSGSKQELLRAIDLGCWFSVGPAMLASNKGRQLTRRIPRDRILTESDGPFARINNQSLRPRDVTKAVDGIAVLWSETPSVVQHTLLENLTALIDSQTY